ncbi:sigma-70 family RNA polymerase sigma factor [Herbivorax sp. ANBcel31]|uniref:sigma-70 family RNA polymerase sigma factor n=1 Tax=Herbivorax sp. ANBcel31 TaxID=3069754 RepID=UPI0027AFCE28|nr:sigma-70 family RNA polymerase sigma factor [Herbivorax sp. ANBcel31]MDQ2086486.1 sigma-70 family RNA polymerase sigma factor [Herbivorax sp. ANBcel31]
MENEDLVKRYQQGNIEALAELTEKNMDLIKFAASKFYISCNYIDFDDLTQESWTGFLKAVETFNPEHESKAKFSTWAIYWIRQSIQRYLEQKTPKSKEKSIYEEYGEDLSLIDSIEDPEIERKLYDYVEKRELRAELERLMKEHLTLQQSEVLKLKYGWTNKKIFTHKDIEKLGFNNSKREHDKAIKKLRETPWGRVQCKNHWKEKRVKLLFQNPVTISLLSQT